MKNSSSRVVLITGAANGIGKAVALSLCEQGHRVAAVDRDQAALECLLDKTSLGQLKIFTADLARDDAAAVIARVQNQFGSIEVLINNAGIGQGSIKPDYHLHPPRFYELTPAQWKLALAVNASAVFHFSCAAVGPMIQRGWGRIINITTSLGTMLRAGYAPYGPSKAAAEALSAVMAGDLMGTGVTVNVVVPGGIVNTPMIPEAAPYERSELIQPDVMLAPINYLISADGDAVTGRRFLGNKWPNNVAACEAAALAGAPIGWCDIAVLPVTPRIRTSVLIQG